MLIHLTSSLTICILLISFCDLIVLARTSGVFTDRSLAWLPFKRPNMLLKESDAPTYTQPMDRSQNPCGWISERLEEAEENNPIGKPGVSSNLDPRDLSDTEPPTRQHTPADMRPLTHIQQRTAWSGPQWKKIDLALKRLEAPGSGEVWWDMCVGRGHPFEDGDGGEEI